MLKISNNINNNSNNNNLNNNNKRKRYLILICTTKINQKISIMGNNSKFQIRIRSFIFINN